MVKKLEEYNTDVWTFAEEKYSDSHQQFRLLIDVKPAPCFV